MVDNPTPAVEVNLLPCPFCGATDGRLVQAFTRATDDFAFWSVECLDCGCEIADDESQEKADTAWNARTPSPGGEVEKLREALWKPADAETRRLGWSYDVADIEAVRDEAEKVCGYDAALEVYHEVMRIAERRLANAALASPPPVEGL